MSHHEAYNPSIHGKPDDRHGAIHDGLFDALRSGPQVVQMNRSSLYQAASVRGVRVSYRTLPDGRLLARLIDEGAEEGGMMPNDERAAARDAEFTESDGEKLTVTIQLTAEQIEMLEDDPGAIEYIRAKLTEAYIGSLPEEMRVLFE